MSDEQRLDIVERAEMVVDGYAFLLDGKIEDAVSIIGLNEPFHAAVLSKAGEVLETNMHDVELSIVKNYWQRNKSLLEEATHA